MGNDKIWWVHYWPKDRDVRVEYKSGNVIMETLSPVQANKLCDTIEDFIEKGVGKVFLPRWAPYDWVWIRE